LSKQGILILWIYGVGIRVIQEADWEEKAISDTLRLAGLCRDAHTLSLRMV